MRYRGMRVPDCNCGAAEEGHAPDCEYVLGCDRVDAILEDEDGREPDTEE